MNVATESAPRASTISNDERDQEQSPPRFSKRRPVAGTEARRDAPRALRFQSLLVPLDGSRAAEHAIPWAMDLASRAGGYVRFMHVHSGPQSRVGRRPTPNRGLDEDREKAIHSEYLGRVAERITRTSRVPVAPLIVEATDVADAIADAARCADIVVMATRRRRTVRRIGDDGIVTELLNRATSPLLITPGYDFPVQRAVPKSIRRMSIPLNGDAESEIILDAAAELSFLTAAECRLIRVVPRRPCAGTRWNGKEWNGKEHDALAYLNRIAFELSSLPSLVSAEIVSSDEIVGEAILADARETDVDLIAVASRGARKLAKCPVNYLVAKSHIPILVALTTPRNLASRKLTRSMSCTK